MIEDSRGQVSIEFILVVGAILTMTLVGIPMILRNAEMNKGLAAARDGATYGAAMRGLGYSYKGGNEPGVVKIINMTPIPKGQTGNLDKYILRFYVKIPSDMDSSSICTTIRRQATSHLKYAFEGQYSTTLAAVDGSYYSFTTGCIAVS